MTELETERLIFRQWDTSDYAVIREFYLDEANARYVGGVKSAEESWRLMATYIGHYELHGYSYLAVAERESRELIGTVGLWNSDPWPEPELGYWLLPDAQGKGYGLEAGIKLKEYALKELRLETLVSYISSSNEPSKRLAGKLGAKYDGLVDLLDFGPHDVYRYW